MGVLGDVIGEGTSDCVAFLIIESRLSVEMVSKLVDIVSLTVGWDFSKMVGKVGSKWCKGLEILLEVPRGDVPVLPNPLDPRVECGRRLTSFILGCTTGVKTS